MQLQRILQLKVQYCPSWGRDEEKNIKFLGIQNNLTFQKDENCGQFYRGNFTGMDKASRQEHSIVDSGDVSRDAAYIQPKDIVVIGSPEGEVYGGATGNNHHFVVALDMNPEKLRIGDLSLYTAGKVQNRD